MQSEEAVATSDKVPTDRATAAPVGATGAAAAAVSDVSVACVAAATDATSVACRIQGVAQPAIRIQDMPERQRVDGEKLPSDVTHVQNEQRRERHWRRLVRSELRDRFITAMYVLDHSLYLKDGGVSQVSLHLWLFVLFFSFWFY